MNSSPESSPTAFRPQNPSVDYREGPGGADIVMVRNEQGSAEISLYGGHVLSFQPAQAAPVLWMSEEAMFEPGIPIRGGIPICWPWFGPDPTGQGRPSHGFARTSMWKLESISTVGKATQLSLVLKSNPETKALWPHQFELRLQVTVGTELLVELTTTNRGSTSFELSQALHSYFAVEEISEVRVLGLEQSRFLDRVSAPREKLQVGPVEFNGETDRDYIETSADCLIEEPQRGRRIRIAKTGSQTTVVWNPWSEKASKMRDFPDDGYRRMLCVETANATEFDTVSLAPGASHKLGVRLSVEA